MIVPFVPTRKVQTIVLLSLLSLYPKFPSLLGLFGANYYTASGPICVPYKLVNPHLHRKLCFSVLKACLWGVLIWPHGGYVNDSFPFLSSVCLWIWRESWKLNTIFTRRTLEIHICVFYRIGLKFCRCRTLETKQE